MLVLDETYTGALFRQAAQDGLVKHAIREDALYKDPTTSKLLKKGVNPQVRQDVLWDLLLFHPAICSPYDNFNVDALLSEGLINDQISNVDQRKYTEEIDSNPDSILLFEKYIIGELKEKGFKDIVSQDVTEYIENLKKYDMGKLYSDGLMYWRYSSYDELRDFHVSGLSGKSLSLPGKENDTPLSGEEFSEIILSDLTEEKFNFYKSNESIFKRGKEIKDVAHKWFLLSGVAIDNDAVLKVKTPRNTPSGSLNETIKTTNATKSVIKIWLSEIETLPKLTTIEDVLRLREEKSIENFKNSVMEWALALSEGVSEEKKIRSHIRTANNELKKLKEVQTVAGWATVISLPIDIAILAAGLPIITSPIGLGFYSYEKYKTHKYDWIMFGR